MAPGLAPGSKVEFWLYRDVELPTASGKKQKLPALITLFDDNAVKPLLKGKPPVCRGLCGMEGGKIAFEAEQGKVPYKQLKVSIPLRLGKMVHIPANAPDGPRKIQKNGRRRANFFGHGGG